MYVHVERVCYDIIIQELLIARVFSLGLLSPGG